MVRKVPIVVNLFAGSGAGKSTCAARIFAMLKEQGLEVELATEYVKDMVWEKRTKVMECQPYIFGKQLYKLVRLSGVVDVIVTDSPIVFSAIYDPKHNQHFKEFVLDEFYEFDNLNYFLNRMHPFNPNGRNENSEEEAIEFDKRIGRFLVANGIDYVKVSADKWGCEKIVQDVLDSIDQDALDESEGYPLFK